MGNPREDSAAWHAISHAGATKDTWIGDKPYATWDWLEDPEDLTAEARYAKGDEADDPGNEDDEFEWTPTR